MALRTCRVGRTIAWLTAVAFLVITPTRVFAQEVGSAPQSRPLMPLYVSFATLQALDVHSTTRALRGGAAEGNPLMRGIADQPAALMAVKAGGAASTIWLAHKMAKRNKTGAVILMAAINAGYAMVVAHNYRSAH